MEKVLVAVVSCHTREAYTNLIRETWLPTVPKEVDVIFFRGRGATRDPKADEIWLDCPDDYKSLPEKVKCIFKYAYENGVHFCMKFDDDSAFIPKKWYEGFHRCDFTGCLESGCKSNEIQTPLGFAYVLSRRSMELIINAPLPGQPGSTHPGGNHGNDEAWCSTLLYINGILLKPDPRYFLHRGGRPKTPARSLRAPKRDAPFVIVPPRDAWAYCAYLNWGGWHTTPDAVNLQEIRWLFDTYCK